VGPPVQAIMTGINNSDGKSNMVIIIHNWSAH